MWDERNEENTLLLGVSAICFGLVMEHGTPVRCNIIKEIRDEREKMKTYLFWIRDLARDLFIFTNAV